MLLFFRMIYKKNYMNLNFFSKLQVLRTFFIASLVFIGSCGLCGIIRILLLWNPWNGFWLTSLTCDGVCKVINFQSTLFLNG